MLPAKIYRDLWAWIPETELNFQLGNFFKCSKLLSWTVHFSRKYVHVSFEIIARSAKHCRIVRHHNTITEDLEKAKFERTWQLFTIIKRLLLIGENTSILRTYLCHKIRKERCAYTPSPSKLVWFIIETDRNPKSTEVDVVRDIDSNVPKNDTTPGIVISMLSENRRALSGRSWSDINNL